MSKYNFVPRQYSPNIISENICAKYTYANVCLKALNFAGQHVLFLFDYTCQYIILVSLQAADLVFPAKN